jgi:hypothetical protein
MSKPKFSLQMFIIARLKLHKAGIFLTPILVIILDFKFIYPAISF